MIRKQLLVSILLVVIVFYQARCCQGSADEQKQQLPKVDTLEKVLTKLNKATADLKSYQSKIEYKFSQPLFDSQTIKGGNLYYMESDEKSFLKIDFRTLKQDDEKLQKHVKKYIFDGVWLTTIDYSIRQVQRRQMSEPNKPMNAFELASENFPIIGFTKTEQLKKDFDIELVENEEKQRDGFIRLHLKTKADSSYDDYTFVDFWIDDKTNLVSEIIAVSTEEDVYEIKLLNAKINEKISEKTFEVKIPEGFNCSEDVSLSSQKCEK